MIRSWTDNGVLTVVIVGKTGRTVSYTTSPFYDIRLAAHEQGSSSRDLRQQSLRRHRQVGAGLGGEERQGRAHRAGRTAAVLFSDTFVSVYQPADWIKRVGTR